MSGRKSFCSFMLGGLIGFGVGLLLAPKKGVELREQIFEKTMDIVTDSQSVKEDVSNFIKTFRNKDGEIEPTDGEIVISREFDEEEEADIVLS